MKKMFFGSTFTLLVLILSSTFLYAQDEDWKTRLKNDPNNVDVLLEAGGHYYEQAAQGNDPEALDKADKCFSTVLEQQPRNGLAMVQLGAVYSLRARDANDPMDKMEFMELSLGKMDKAAQLNPDDARVLLTRGVIDVYLPEMFQRLPLAVADFSHIEELAGKGDIGFSGEEWQTFYFHYGLALKNLGKASKAEDLFARTAALNPESTLGRQAAELINGDKK